MESARIIPSRAFQIIQISADDDQSKQLGSVRQQQGTGHGIARHLSGVIIRLAAVSACLMVSRPMRQGIKGTGIDQSDRDDSTFAPSSLIVTSPSSFTNPIFEVLSAN